jgi:glycosyltransferase involved in cell wall biosynthesis
LCLSLSLSLSDVEKVKLELSVIIPTHNPRRDYLERVLEALAGQTLDRSKCELVIVDNASSEMGDGRWEMGGIPNARIVREERLGLTNARLRGFAETKGEIIVLVDDDNVLAPDYLEQTVRIGKEHPQLGTWSGAIELVLEPGSPEPAEKLRGLLCERKVERALWSNDRSHFAATPWGAGECIRRKVAEAYADKVAREPRRRQLDLQGTDLVYGGDTDIAYTGCEIGYAMGVFPELKVKHLTPPTRCTEKYLLKTYEARAYSEVLHGWIETGKIPPQRTDLRGRLGAWARVLTGSGLERKMIKARNQGLKKGEQFVQRQIRPKEYRKP